MKDYITRLRTLRFQLAIWIPVIVLVSYSASGYIASSIMQEPERPSDGEDAYITASSIEELVDKSGTIVIGTITSTPNTINMARNVDDVNQEDPNFLIVGQVYQISVQRYLKGTGPSMLSFAQPEAFLGPRIPKNQIEIAAARRIYEYVQPQPNTNYLLFLEPLRGFPTQQYYVIVAQPGRFTLADPSRVVPESPWHKASQTFSARRLDDFLRQIQQRVRISTP